MSAQLAKKIEDTLSKLDSLKGDIMLREVRSDLLKVGITDKMLNDAGFIEAKYLSGIGFNPSIRISSGIFESEKDKRNGYTI